jgi:hypothetical protein
VFFTIVYKRLTDGEYPAVKDGLKTRFRPQALRRRESRPKRNTARQRHRLAKAGGARYFIAD